MENNSSVVILAVNSSTQDLLASIKSFKAAGVKNIMMLDSAKYGFVPVLDASVKLFHTDKALLDEIAKLDGFVYITRRFNAPKDFVQIAFGADRKKTDAYSFTGYKLLKPVDEKLPNVEVEWFNRKPNAPRYLKNDSGDKVVDYFPETGFMVHSSRVAELCKTGVLRVFDSHVRATTAFKDAGMELVCLDSPWGRPVRLSTRNSGRKYLKADELASIKKTVKNSTTKKQSTVNNASAATVHTEILLEKTEPMERANRIGVPATTAKPNGDKPVLSVVFQTHNRTATACFCLESVCKNLKYDGSIHFCICDDRSFPGHTEALVKILKKYGVDSYSVHKTYSRRWGLGSSINNGLLHSFKFTEVVLTMEDDFFCRKELDITPYVKVVLNKDVAGIKLAALSVKYNPVRECKYDGFYHVTSNMDNPPERWYVFNNLVMLRHKRVFDRIGLYRENCDPRTMENDMVAKFNIAFDAGRSNDMMILWPKKLTIGTYNTEFFLHVGKSTLGHRYGRPPKEFEFLADGSKDEKLRDGAIMPEIKFHVITPCYNSSSFIERCIESVARQNMGVRMTIVDDCSDIDDFKKTAEIARKFDFVQLVASPVRSMAGGARNIAIENAPDSEYTLFLDSDDTFVDDSVLSKLYDHIEKTKRPDLVCLGYMNNGTKRIFNFFSKSDLSTMGGAAPWTRCVRTPLVRKFVENRRMFNDVVQFIRTVDIVETVSSVDFPVVDYRKDNPHSGWHNKNIRLSKDGIAAQIQVIQDIMFEPLATKEGREAAVRRLNYEYKNLGTTIASMKPDDSKNKYAMLAEEKEPISREFIDKAIQYTSKYVKGDFVGHPETIQQKIAWIKLFDCSRLKTMCADKVLVHEYVRETLGVDICVPILKEYASPDQIDFSELPDRFVLKCNHGSGYNIIVTHKDSTNAALAKKKLSEWLGTDFSTVGYEPQYSNIPRKCFAEMYVGDSVHDTTDYKFVCLNGEPKFCQVITGRSTSEKKSNLYDMNFNFMDLGRLDLRSDGIGNDERPKTFDLMKYYAKALAKPFKLVRVDFFEVDGQLYLGELTFTPGNARMKYKDDPKTGLMLGNMLKLS